MNISYFKFDVDDVTGELDSTRPVPFRMTPNVAEFVTSIGKVVLVNKLILDKCRFPHFIFECLGMSNPLKDVFYTF